MLGLSEEISLPLYALIAVVGLIVLITRFRFHPFVALAIAALFLGLVAGMPAVKVVKSFQTGFGSVVGFVGIVLGLGTMLGKLMAESGGADQIAKALLGSFGKERVHWAMMFVAFIVGIPLFFEIGFVLLMPLVFIMAKRVQMPLVKIAIPLLAGLSVVHGLVPPHPGPLLAISIYGADIGKTILYGLIVGLPTAIVAGPLFGNFIARYVNTQPAPELAAQLAHEPEAKTLPSVGVTLITVLLPVFLMLLKSFADIVLKEGTLARQWLDFVGDPIIALLAALVLAFFTFGYARGFDSKRVLKFVDESLTPIASIILIIGGGGGFKQMLVDTGVGNAIGQIALQSNISPILLAWLAAAMIRVATGSATVATITGAGLVAPLVTLIPDVNRELLVLATGAGSVILSHVNDAGFWLVKQYLNMTVAQTFKTWTVMETLLSVVGLFFILILSMFL